MTGLNSNFAMLEGEMKFKNMNTKEENDLVEAWIKLTKIAFEKSYDHPEADELFWASMKLTDLVSDEPQTAWNIILRILNADQDPIILMNLSAGPLEDLLAKHGKQIINVIEAEAATNKAFRELLSGVWKNSMDDEIWSRVQAVIMKYD